jgi:hypothetical protein
MVMFAMRRLAHQAALDLVESLSTPFAEVKRIEEDIAFTTSKQVFWRTPTHTH